MSTSQDRRWICGSIESVNLEQRTIFLWLDEDEFEKPQEVTIEDVPPWMRFPGVNFDAYIPRSCLETGNIGGVIWGPFFCNGMEYWTEEETYWQMGQIWQRVADRQCDEDLLDGPARACESSLRLLIQKLLGLHQSETWPTLPESTASQLEDAVQEIRSTLIQAFQALDRDYPSLHVLCTSALKKHAPDNEDDFTGCSDLQRLHAHISYLLDCEADAVILARLLMEIYPDQTNSLQAMIEQYHQQAVSPIANLLQAED